MSEAEATHHSSRGQKTATAVRRHEAPRGQKTPPPGERPGILAEPGPQRSDRSLRRSPGDSHPTIGLPVLAEVSGDALDASTVPLPLGCCAAGPEPAVGSAAEGEGPGVGEQADEEEEEEEE